MADFDRLSKADCYAAVTSWDGAVPKNCDTFEM